MFLKSLPSRPQSLPSLGVSDKHRRRVRALLLFGCGLVIVLDGAWGVYYALHAKWLAMTLNAVMAATGGAALFCTLTGRLRAASLIAVPMLLIMISTFCFLVDIPAPGIPRSVHMHLLSLAAAAFLLFRGEKAYLRLGMPVLCFAACLVFGSTQIGYANADFMPPAEVRAIGVWINNGSCIFTLGVIMLIMQADIAVRNAIEADLRMAVAQGHFVLHHQPQVGEHGRIIGAEALLRWQHPQRGMIPPGKFIPVAEETGLIVPIGEWVLKMACAQLVHWAGDPRTAELTLAVNVSASQFRQPDFVPLVLEIVERSGVQPSRLKLELTESMLVKDIDEVIDKMTALQARGVAFSLDDFGTGFSSLSYLKRLPLAQLKIDQSFVRDVLTDPSDMAIVRTLVALGESMGLMVIAEGVETEGQRVWLRDNGCRAYQGYLFSKPLPVGEFEALVQRLSTAAEPQAVHSGVDAAPSVPVGPDVQAAMHGVAVT